MLNWFIDNSLPYWYLFTERYTMIDSRAKNTFYHYGKIYITEDEASGAKVTELTNIKNSHLEEYIENNHIQAYKTATAQQIANAELEYQIATATFLHENAQYFEVNNDKAAINNGYRFEMWGYDMDTALGINNNGQMVFSAGVEDIDKDASGWIYNEAESVIWRRVRENMYNQLAALYINLKGDCFNAENLIEEFDRLQAQFPEELWRADFERKYYRPFRDLNETTYLNDMANGRKKYQRRQFERNMAIYINSKYQRNGSYLENDLISFRPQFTWTAGRDTRIIIKPYSTMYINFALGNYDNTDDSTSTTAQSIFKRVERGEEFVINTSDYIHDYNNIQCILYNASRIMYLDGLGNFECKQFILGAAKKLSVLKLGSPVYENHSMTDITNLGLSTGLPLLEELDLTNIEFGTVANGNWISNPPQTFALENFPLLKRLDATGCNIRSFTFKDGGMLEHIIFPSGLTSIQFKNLYNLIDTYDENSQLIPAVVLTGAANLISYYSTNSYASSYTIVQNMINNSQDRITQLYLDDINWTINNITDLEPLANLQRRLGNNMFLKGTITVTGTWSQVEKDNYAGTPSSIWPNLTLNTIGTEQVKRKYIFRYNNKEYTTYVTVNNPVPDPRTPGAEVIELPEKAPDPMYKYTFGAVDETTGNYIPYSGWKYESADTPLGVAPIANVGTDAIVLEPYFKGIERKYTIRWFLDEQRTQKVGERDDISYGSGEEVLIPTVANIHEGNYMSSMAVYGQYETCIDVSVSLNGDVQYKLFTGWDKLPVNIQPDGSTDYFDIFAVWDNVTTSVAEVFSNVVEHQLTPRQLLVLAAMPSSLRANAPYNMYDEAYQTVIQLGRDSAQVGNTIVSDNGDALYLSGSNSYDDRAYSTNYQPFKDKAFTFVIDYTFDDADEDEGTYSMLASCYHSINNVTHGFGIFKNNTTNTIEVGFGDMYKNSNNRVIVNSSLNSNMRNIVVLRHPAIKPGDEYERLYVYSSQGPSNSMSETSVYSTSIPRTANINFTSDAYLNIGQLIDSSRETVQSSEDLSDRIHAKAKIHWAKYWNYDIGAGECEQIAAWPHEQITFGIAHIQAPANNGARAVAVPTPSLYLATLSTPTHGKYSSGQIQTGNFNSNFNSYAWRDTGLRKIYNNRIFNAFPLELQSVLMKPNVGQYPVIHNDGDGQGYGQSYTFENQITNTRDYVYAYSAANVLDDNSMYDREDQLLSPFGWKSASKVAIYNYSTSSGWGITGSNSNYLNIRFPYKPIAWGENDNRMRVYAIDQLANISGSVAASIGASKLRSGDILLTNGQAYIYISNKEINRYGLYPERNNSKLTGLPDNQVASMNGYSSNTGSGGWIKGVAYWTRSLVTSTNRASLVDVSATGIADISSTDSTAIERNFSFIIAL